MVINDLDEAFSNSNHIIQASAVVAVVKIPTQEDINHLEPRWSCIQFQYCRYKVSNGSINNATFMPA